MAELNDQQKLEIVLALARFEGLSDIVKDFAARGIEVDATQVGRYDPTRPYFVAGEKWKKHFEEARERYLTEVSAVPIANQGYRLQVLQKTLDGAVKSGNKVLANATLRQAAEEVGGALTNERNVKTTIRPSDEMTSDERRMSMAELIRQALEFKDPKGTSPAPEATQ